VALGVSIGLLSFTSSSANAQISPQIEWSFQDSNLIGAISTVDFSPNGNFVAYGAEFTRYVMVRRVSDGQLLRTFNGSANLGMRATEFAPNGGRLGATWSILGFTGLIFGGAETFNGFNTGALLTTSDHDAEVTDLTWSPDSQYILTGSLEGKADLVDALTGALMLEVDHGAAVTSVAFSDNGQYFATGGEFGNVTIWDATTGAMVTTITAHLSKVSEMEFHSNNTTLVTGGGEAMLDSKINVWDWATGNLLASHSQQTEGITGLAFFNGGTLLMSADLSGVIRISQTFGPNQVQTIDLGHGPRVSSLDLHIGAQRYAYGTSSGWITMARR